MDYTERTKRIELMEKVNAVIDEEFDAIMEDIKKHFEDRTKENFDENHEEVLKLLGGEDVLLRIRGKIENVILEIKQN